MEKRVGKQGRTAVRSKTTSLGKGKVIKRAERVKTGKVATKRSKAAASKGEEVAKKDRPRETKKAATKAVGRPASSGRYEQIWTMLVGQKRVLLNGAGASLESALRTDAETLPDVGDQASLEEDQSFLFRLHEREQQLLRKIDDALIRIRDGTFGICESCSSEIALLRLKARPVTTLCIECKTRQELDERNRQ